MDGLMSLAGEDGWPGLHYLTLCQVIVSRLVMNHSDLSPPSAYLLARQGNKEGVAWS